MHWTAFLAYRRIPANARVIGDVHCIACGYNLRSLLARSLCPECGGPVADSLIVLAQPQIVAVALRSFSNSYRTFLILGLGCVTWWVAGWPLLVTSMFIAGSALYRMLNAGELRFRGQLGNSVSLQTLVTRFWWTSCIEATASVAWVAAVLACLYSPTFAVKMGQYGLAITAAIWLYAAFLNAAAAGWFGYALATTLGYHWLMVIFRIQIIAVTISGLIGVLLYVLLTSVISKTPALILACFIGLVFIVTLVLTWIALHQLANAAEQETGSWDDLVVSDRLAMAPEEN